MVSDTDWYTQYFSKGYYQEGQAAARYLHGLEDPKPARKVLQIIENSLEGKALAQGFRDTWAELGQAAMPEILLPEGKPLALATLADLLAREKPSTVLLWTGASAFPALTALTRGATGAFMSARLLGSQLTSLPELVRTQVWITYPYRDPKLEPKYSLYADTLLGGLMQRHPETRISTRTYALIQILRQALMDMDRHFYRDNLLDRIGMQRDQILPDYLRLSFGPGQRYASKGCFIMQVGPGPSPVLLRKSEWVIH